MSALAAGPIDECRMLCHAVVPYYDGAGLPLDTGMEVGTEGDVVIQELEQRVRFFLLQTDDFAGDYPEGQLQIRERPSCSTPCG